jgi:phosphoribosylamine-glycine ligase
VPTNKCTFTVIFNTLLVLNFFSCYVYSASYKALVVKASGLSAGKGVVVAQTRVEACQAVTDIMTVRKITCLC